MTNKKKSQALKDLAGKIIIIIQNEKTDVLNEYWQTIANTSDILALALAEAAKSPEDIRQVILGKKGGFPITEIKALAKLMNCLNERADQTTDTTERPSAEAEEAFGKVKTVLKLMIVFPKNETRPENFWESINKTYAEVKSLCEGKGGQNEEGDEAKLDPKETGGKPSGSLVRSLLTMLGLARK